ncbi:Tyrocidine synthase III [Serratia rubidaea]|uniref:Tyrocidine synthase III n=1 Tax=Serratia rubidaea TaxID=61652 RepID=A0A4U9H980_SERRU|nr:Tyrocidine synthase III [Serratia rubidaea]
MANHVLDAFIQQVSTSPTHPAIIDKDNKNISYQQLDDLSNRLCALLQRRGVGPGDYIPLLAQRTPQLIIGMLAIVKAGAAYIPLDSSYPEQRIKYIIEKKPFADYIIRP